MRAWAIKVRGKPWCSSSRCRAASLNLVRHPPKQAVIATPLHCRPAKLTPGTRRYCRHWLLANAGRGKSGTDDLSAQLEYRHGTGRENIAITSLHLYGTAPHHLTLSHLCDVFEALTVEAPSVLSADVQRGKPKPRKGGAARSTTPFRSPSLAPLPAPDLANTPSNPSHSLLNVLWTRLTRLLCCPTCLMRIGNARLCLHHPHLLHVRSAARIGAVQHENCQAIPSVTHSYDFPVHIAIPLPSRWASQPVSPLCGTRSHSMSVSARA